MKRRTAIAVLAATWLGAAAQQPGAPDYDAAAAACFSNSLRTTIDDLRNAGLAIDPNRFLDLFVRAYRGDSIGCTPQQGNELLMAALESKRPAAVAPMDAAAETEWVKAQLALPRTEELPGGVVLQRLTEGSGEQPGPESVVMVMYTGRLSSGAEFDRTDSPFPLPMNQIVAGLSEAMQQMRCGGTYRVFIPPAMGYGEEAVMDLIPGNSALDFTIEIQEIKK